jgi:hypothetical protein
MSPTTGTPTVSPFSFATESPRKARTSIGRDIVSLRRRKPLSSSAARCLDTEDDDRSPTASPICRVLGEYPCWTTQSRIVTRICCWRSGSAEASRCSKTSS